MWGVGMKGNNEGDKVTRKCRVKGLLCSVSG